MPGDYDAGVHETIGGRYVCVRKNSQKHRVVVVLAMLHCTHSHPQAMSRREITIFFLRGRSISRSLACLSFDSSVPCVRRGWPMRLSPFERGQAIFSRENLRRSSRERTSSSGEVQEGTGPGPPAAHVPEEPPPYIAATSCPRPRTDLVATEAQHQQRRQQQQQQRWWWWCVITNIFTRGEGWKWRRRLGAAGGGTRRRS